MSASLRRLPALIVALSLAAAPVARAQEKPDSKTAAKEHYQRGTTYYDLGKYDDAIKEFEAAYHLKNDPAFLYNLAQAYRLVGNNERALHFYRTFLRYVPKSPKRAEIEDRIKALEQQQATGSKPMGTTPPPPGTTTTPPPGGTTPPPPDTTPPTVTVTPTTPGTPPPPATTYPPPVTTVPPPPMAGTTPPPPPAPDPGRKFRIAGIATGGAGAALILIGMIQGARAVGAANDIEDAAMAGMAFDPDVEKRGKSAEKAQWWCLGLGVLAGAGGAGLWYYGKRVSAEAETTTWRVSLAPIVTPTVNGGSLRITF